jgi:hypothetical protein
MTLWPTQPPTEMSTRNLPEGKCRAVPKADNLTSSVSHTSGKFGNLDVSQTYGPPRPVIGVLILKLVQNYFLKQRYGFIMGLFFIAFVVLRAALVLRCRKDKIAGCCLPL